MDFPGGSDGKASAYNAGDPGSILGSGRSPGEGKGNPLQYSCLENPMDRAAWWLFQSYLFIFPFWPRRMGYVILVPPPGIEPGPSVVKVWSPNHWITREFPEAVFFKSTL